MTKVKCFLLETPFRQKSILDFSFTQIRELLPYLTSLEVSSEMTVQGNENCIYLQFTYIYLQGPVKVEQKNSEKEKQIPLI